MKNLLKLYLTTTALFVSSLLISQNTFYKQFINDSENNLPTRVVQCPNGNFVFCASWNYIDEVQIFNVDGGGSLNWSLKAQSSGSQPIHLTGLVVDNNNNITLFGYGGNSQYGSNFLFKFDEFGQKKWDILLGGSYVVHFDVLRNRMTTTTDGGYIIGQTKNDLMPGINGEPECMKVGADGEVLWAKRYNMGEEEILFDLLTTQSDNIYMATIIYGTEEISSLIYTTSDGEPVWTKSYDDFLIRKMNRFQNGDLLISGKIGDYPIILRTDGQGEPIWAKKINMPYTNSYAGHAVTPEGKAICTYYEFSFLLDGNGNLEWAWDNGGIPVATQDGGYAFLDAYLDNNNKITPTLKKTDENGMVEGCEFDIPCLTFEDVTIEVVPGATYTTIDIPIDTALELSFVPNDVLVEDYCPPPTQEPSAEFTAPSIVCKGDCFLLSNLQQHDADTWVWTFGGLSQTSAMTQDPGEICALVPGVYELKQVITFSGCIDSFSTMIEVLSDIQPDLGNDTLICTGDFLQLDATTIGATIYTWDDQTDDPMREITNSGNYSVTVANGQCEGTDSIDVRFFAEQYPPNILDLGPALTHCEGTVVALNPAVPAGLQYEWSDGELGSSREITAAGQYELIGTLKGCSISDFVEINFETCEGQVYIPNAFSPNNDGFNDYFEIYSDGIEILQLKVFNRWGGLVFEANGNDSKWDGIIKGKPAQVGVYVYLLDYVDVYSGEAATVSGNVMVLK